MAGDWVKKGSITEPAIKKSGDRLKKSPTVGLFMAGDRGKKRPITGQKKSGDRQKKNPTTSHKKSGDWTFFKPIAGIFMAGER